MCRPDQAPWPGPLRSASWPNRLRACKRPFLRQDLSIIMENPLALYLALKALILHKSIVIPWSILYFTGPTMQTLVNLG